MRGWRGALAVFGVLVATVSCTSPPPVSGLDTAGLDRTARPQDDLFRFTNGTWLDTTEIPADRSRYGAFDMLADRAREDVRVLIEDLDAGSPAPGSAEQQVADLYASHLDTATIDRLGSTPLRDELARIDAISGPDALAAHFGHLGTVGLPSPVAAAVGQDDRDPDSYALFLNQDGLSLPDRDYYLSDDEPFPGIRERFTAHVTRMLELAGLPDPTAGARILALETRLARAQRDNVALRDPEANYNPFPVTRAPGLDWRAYLDAGAVDTDRVVVGQPDFFTALGSALTEVPLADWQAYLRFCLVDHYAPYLAAPLAEASFDFNGRLLQGVPEQRPRWQRAVALVDRTVGEAVGRAYVERHFSAESKKRMEALVDDLVAAFGTSIDELDWMGEATKAEARAKLDLLGVKIGYPDIWREYPVEIRRDDLVGNLARAARAEHDRAVAKLDGPVDRGEWFLTPQTVNAYYSPALNEIVFPAAILQPPFFDPAADDAVNYGAIGAVIGHEISHAFDDQGRKYDGTGLLRDWWSPQDVERFTAITDRLVTQAGTFEPLPGTPLNGELTLGENIADVAGLTIAHEAYLLSLDGTTPPEIDGFTGEQRVFLGWAQVWRTAQREEALRQQILTGPHSPAEFRVNGVVPHVPGFADAFGLTPADSLYLPPERRVVLW
jgi:putative endopeptidase